MREITPQISGALLMVATQMHRDKPELNLMQCYQIACDDYHDKAMTDGFINFLVDHPHATVALEWKGGRVNLFSAFERVSER